jgi:hypothetical protein
LPFGLDNLKCQILKDNRYTVQTDTTNPNPSTQCRGSLFQKLSGHMSQNPQYPRYRSQTQLLFGFNVELKRPHRKKFKKPMGRTPCAKNAENGYRNVGKGGVVSQRTDVQCGEQRNEKGRALVVTFTEPESW